MKNSKQVNLSMSVVETLDRIREQLPKRGTLKASYGDAITAINNQRNEQKITIQGLTELRKKKKARK